MADWIDNSVAQQEATLSAQASARRAEGPAATGFCLHCAEALPEHVRWGDASCRDQWEREQKLRVGMR